jgi:putative hemin transport protein
VSASALKQVLELAAERSERIMIFVGNHGVVQIFIGEIKRVVETPGWLNVLDPGFNLHVRPEAIATSWIVRKPTVDGTVSALECYDTRGRLVVQLFGKRLEGQPSPDGWQAILTAVEQACA